MLVATKDRVINPDLERWYAARAKSQTVEVAGASHAVYISQAERTCGSDRRGCIEGSLEA
jgi:pimeloyl-ACP methyl ester carboxylesterase